MITKYQYDSVQEREQILEENKNLYLIEEQNIHEGDFLIFSDVEPVFDIPNPDEDIIEIKSRIELMQKVLDELLLGGAF